MLEVFLEFAERQTEDVARHDAVVSNDTQRQTALEYDLSLLTDGDLAEIAHRKRDRGGSEIVDVVVDRIGLDAGEIGEDDRAMEGRRLNDRLGTPVMLIEPFDEVDRYAQESRYGTEEVRELVGGVDIALFAIGRDIGIDDIVDLVDRTCGRELHLADGGSAVDLAALEDDHADRDLVAGIDTLIDDKAVELGIFRKGAYHSGKD